MKQGKPLTKSLSLHARMMITSAVLITVSMFSVIMFDYITNSSYSESLLVKEAQKITETITARTNDWLSNNKNLINYTAKTMIFENPDDFQKYSNILNELDDREEIIQVIVWFDNGETLCFKKCCK